MRELLHEIILSDGVADDEIKDMFYRSDADIRQETDNLYSLKESSCYDFSTYFNSCSKQKWQLYTKAKKIYLELNAQGQFFVVLTGFYVDEQNIVHKECFGEYRFDLKDRDKVVLPYPEEAKSSVVSFQIITVSKVFIYGGGYYTDIENSDKKAPFITLVTTTFKKEEYIYKNLSLINKDLFSDDEFSDHFNWIIVDNGRSLDPARIENSRVKVFANKNVGGAGGFAKGIIEGNKQTRKPSHVLLMDDDVEFMTQGFKRVYKFLSLLKEEYNDYFISGAMLELSQKNIQHEDIGVFSPDGKHGPTKPRYDLCETDNVIRNELIIEHDIHNYSGWWFCCIPIQTARLDNLPLPFFFRGDDVEYSIRNGSKIISLNGVCIWHQGFGTKFSALVEFYQVHRNDFIIRALREDIKDINIIGRIEELFWQEIYKYNYKGADLLIDSIEDYLKGPEFLSSLNGEQLLKEKKLKDNEMSPLPPEILSDIKDIDINLWEPMNKLSKFIYDYTCNGQKIISYTKRKKSGYILYGWGYCQKKIAFCDKIYALDLANNQYTVFSKDREEFKRIVKRFNDVKEEYKTTHETVDKRWKEAEKSLTSISFWEKYLNE